MDVEAALIVVCPEAEAAVGDQRVALDRAAAVGVPAHMTVLYPFVPDLTDADHERLAGVLAGMPSFMLAAERTDWFGDAVVFVPPSDPTPLVALTRAVETAFPAYPSYGGVFDEVIPHLTIGHDQPVETLRAAERAVLDHLPFAQVVDRVELWSGPELATAPPNSWRRVRHYDLAPAH